MKPAITTLQPPKSPPKPHKGDIAACKRYACYHAARSTNPKATLAHIWTRFIAWSYLQDQTPKTEYTGWKVQQKQLVKLKAVQL